MPVLTFRSHLSTSRLRLSNISSPTSSLRALISAMAGTGEDLSSAVNNADLVPVDSLTDSQVDAAVVAVDSSNADDVKYGFQRPEMHKTSLAGTVDPYDRHVFLCFKSPANWPRIVEDPEYDPLPGRLAEYVYSRKDDLSVKTRLTICEGKEGADGDVLIFPDMIKYKDLKYEEVDVFSENVLLKGAIWDSKLREELTGSHIFVCAHGSRDRRCGICGPALIEKLNQEIELRGVQNEVYVRSCSHVGGHKYAGNVIIFSPNSEGKVVGHWYGYVTPDDIPTLLDQHIGKGVIIERLWRGQMGPSNNEDKQVDEQKPQENSDAAILKGTNSDKIESESKGTSTQVDMQDGGSCCQGANGFSCCRDGSVESSIGNAEKKQKKGVNLCGKGTNRVLAWMGKWEQSDVLAAAAVIGAVATVAVAYSFYKRSH